jgi:hypothetical protein
MELIGLLGDDGLGVTEAGVFLDVHFLPRVLLTVMQYIIQAIIIFFLLGYKIPTLINELKIHTMHLRKALQSATKSQLTQRLVNTIGKEVVDTLIGFLIDDSQGVTQNTSQEGLSSVDNNIKNVHLDCFLCDVWVVLDTQDVGMRMDLILGNCWTEFGDLVKTILDTHRLHEILI